MKSAFRIIWVPNLDGRILCLERSRIVLADVELSRADVADALAPYDDRCVDPDALSTTEVIDSSETASPRDELSDDVTSDQERANCPDWCQRHVNDPGGQVIHQAKVTVGNQSVEVEMGDNEDVHGLGAGVPAVCMPDWMWATGQDLQNCAAVLQRAADLIAGAQPGELVCPADVEHIEGAFQDGYVAGRRVERSEIIAAISGRSTISELMRDIEELKVGGSA